MEIEKSKDLIAVVNDESILIYNKGNFKKVRNIELKQLK